LAAVAEQLRRGRLDEARSCLTDTLADHILQLCSSPPIRTELLVELGDVLFKIGRERQAELCYKRLVEFSPSALAYNKLGCLCQATGRLCQALQYQQKALELAPDRPELQANLARALMETGRLQQGIHLLRQAVERMPDNPQAHSNLLFRLHQLPEIDRQELFEEHKRWAARYATADMIQSVHENDPDPHRPLRVGYISPDFRRHSVAYFFESILDGHDRRFIKPYGYGNVEFADQITERLKQKFHCYRDIRGLDHQTVAELIRSDQIDILVDLAGHVGDNCLLVLAHKPAPVQVTYLGYPDTTGVQAIDYRLTDELADPPSSQCYYTEQLVYLPDGFLCYRPPDWAPPVSPLPAERNGCITFGSFNNNCKINHHVVQLWARLLQANPGSRLLLKLKGGNEPEVAEFYISQFERHGVDRRRLWIVGWTSPQQHLEMYGQMDIALDTFPYNGTTTTCEALWMGVPVVTLVGQAHLSRVGLSILSRLGLEFFAAESPDEYIAKASSLAANRPALAQLRLSMRARIAASGLCHARAFTRQLEQAYRRMWQNWCRSQSSTRPAGQCARP